MLARQIIRGKIALSTLVIPVCLCIILFIYFLGVGLSILSLNWFSCVTFCFYRPGYADERHKSELLFLTKSLSLSGCHSWTHCIEMLLCKGYCLIKFWTISCKNRRELLCDELEVSTIFFHELWSS